MGFDYDIYICKKEFAMKHKYTWPMVFALMLIVALGLLIYYIPLSHSKNTISSLGYPSDLSSGWYRKVDNTNRDIDIKCLDYYIDDNGTVTIYYKLPGSSSPHSNVLALHTSNIAFNLYIDDELEYSQGLHNRNFNLCRSLGNCWSFIEVPSNAFGTVIRMNITTFYNDGSESITEAYYGNSAVILQNILKNNAAGITVCIILAFFGLAFMMSHLVNNFILKFKLNTFYIGLFIFICAVWSACHTSLPLLFFNDANLVNIFERIITLILPIPIMLHFERNFKVCSTVLYKIGYVLLIANFFIQLTICFIGILDFHQMMKATYIISFYCAAIIMYSMCLHRKSSIENDTNTFFDSFVFAGFIIFFTGVLIDVLCVALSSFSDNSVCIRFSLLIFSIALSAKLLSDECTYAREYSLSESVHKLAYSDALTGLGNRTSFTSTLLETELVKRQYSTLAIYIFDVNYLKYVNDNFGHQHGDKLIISCADAIKQVFEHDFKLFRIGGDEFAAIYMGTDSDDVIRNRLNDFNKAVKTFNDTTLHPFDLSVAVGVAFMNSSRTETMDELFKRADRIMYDNKKEMKHKLSI